MNRTNLFHGQVIYSRCWRKIRIGDEKISILWDVCGTLTDVCGYTGGGARNIDAREKRFKILIMMDDGVNQVPPTYSYHGVKFHKSNGITVLFRFHQLTQLVSFTINIVLNNSVYQ